ncbi:hypothetical protein AB9K17_24020, partial [Salmonella enterica subsp. enterica serovar Kentucky]|uniref:hypothetical protein n=1 Tax=Salmonella enterica TaxID=28901 RepID=UPI003F4B60EB
MTVSESGITFVWPETRGGDTANFTCPLMIGTGVIVHVARMCDIGGVWQSFDETSCGVVLG